MIRAIEYFLIRTICPRLQCETTEDSNTNVDTPVTSKLIVIHAMTWN